jgi:nitrogen fixation protein FixH
MSTSTGHEMRAAQPAEAPNGARAQWREPAPRSGRPTPEGLDHDPRRGRWIPWVFVGGMALVVVVNAVMVWFALSTFTGVTTLRPYDRGRTYNDVLAEAARQDALGWRSTVKLADDTLVVEVRDPRDAPVRGELLGALHRPLNREAIPLHFRDTGYGRWVAPLGELPAGQWEARLTLDGRDGRLDIRRRVFAP